MGTIWYSYAVYWRYKQRWIQGYVPEWGRVGKHCNVSQIQILRDVRVRILDCERVGLALQYSADTDMNGYRGPYIEM